MRPAYFTLTDDGFVPGESAKSWWVPGMIHGRLLGGLMARQLQTAHGDPEFQFSRLTVDMFRNAPVRAGAGGQRRRPRGTPHPRHRGDRHHQRRGGRPGQRGAAAPRRAAGRRLPTRTPVWDAPDPATVPRSFYEFGDDPSRRRMWIREKSPLVDGETLSPFVRAALAADMASPLAHRSHGELEFINADYTLVLSRDPVGPHIGLESGGHASDDGVAAGHITMHDAEGPIGFSMAVAVANIRAV